MRYVEGRDLGQILQAEGALGLGRTLFILDQVASALDAAHEQGLVHRDVKPANVLLVGDTDRAYLTDFGVAKPTTSAGLTRTGIFIGTPDYSTPEQIEGREVDARTDVYSLGSVLYASLTGLAPYARTTEMAVLQAHLMEPPPKLRDARPELPRALDRVIATAMAKAKEDRYPSCGDLLLAAEAAAHEREHRAAFRGRGETVDARLPETVDVPDGERGAAGARLHRRLRRRPLRPRPQARGGDPSAAVRCSSGFLRPRSSRSVPRSSSSWSHAAAAARAQAR